MNTLLFKRWIRLVEVLIAGGVFWACTSSNDDGGFAGGTTEDAGIIADLNVAGVTQKGPFVTGSRVVVQGIDCKTMEMTNEIFEGAVKNDKGDFGVEDVNLSATCALFEVTGYYFNEVTGKKSAGEMTLHALSDLKDRNHVNINMLTELEYKRVMNLVAEEKMSFADAKKRAEKEVLAAFNVNSDYALSEDLNIFEKGTENAALLAVSVLVQADFEVTPLVERVSAFSKAFAQSGTLENSAKTEMADWAIAAKSNGQIAKIRENLESLGYAEEIPAFENVVEKFAASVSQSGSSSSVTQSESSSGSVIPASSGNLPSASSSSSSVILSSGSREGSSGSNGNFDWSVPKQSYLNPEIEYDSIVDSRDGRVYKTVKIGTQNWMAENLNYSDSATTPNLKENSWCFNDSLKNCEVAGRLYTWSAVIAVGQYECGVGMKCGSFVRHRGICPNGWHLPDTSEMRTLFNSAHGRSIGGRMLKSKSGWNAENNGADALGFSAIPAGSREDINDGLFDFDGWNASFWTSTEYDSDKAFYMHLDVGYDVVSYEKNMKNLGFSVRCIEDYEIVSSSSRKTAISSSSLNNQTESSSSEDFDWSVPKYKYQNAQKANYNEFKDKRDRKIYLTIEVGDQTWMAENLNYADSAQTPSLKGNSWCYGNKEQSCEVAGRLYTWTAAKDACPDGWRLPDSSDWSALIKSVGGAGELGAVLRSQTGWIPSFITPTDDIGFSAIPAGKRLADGSFRFAGSYTDFWSSSTASTKENNAYSLILNFPEMGERAGLVDIVEKDEAVSVRCIKN